jgi:aminopeptidase N
VTFAGRCWTTAIFVATLVAFILPLTAAATAETVPDFVPTPGKLPKSVVPLHYEIELAPDLDKLAFKGREKVHIEVLEPTDRLMLNALELTIETASLDDIASAEIVFDAAAQTVTLSFPRPLAAGRHLLSLGFTGRINRFGRGLFVVDYPVGDDGRKRMMSSHLEPTDARRVFPSWDEPAFKASFALTATVPEHFLAVSNMPIVEQEAAGDGLKRIAFAATPRMSSYLFVLTVGELERITGEVDDVTIGVVTTRGKTAQGRFALDSAVDLLRYYNDYFGIAYPLPKLDLIAVPGGFGGAMENWGGITFFEGRLLFDPSRNASDAQRGIFSVLAHEMAHQWFGNLVTMAWWDDIWLNEGFASWMQAKAGEHLHPDWQTWLNGNAGKQRAMAEDAQRTAHSIQHPVANESEAMAAFDSITYVKGQALIRMLESYLGEETFAAGIRTYMRRHALGNTTTADLWRALEIASGRPVAEMAAGFTEQPGVPLVQVRTTCAADRQRIALVQSRFTIHDPKAKELRWKVPVIFGSPGAAAPATVVLDGNTVLDGGRCGTPVKFNLGDVGYYRVLYDDASFAALTTALDHMETADRLNLLVDNWALVEAGSAPPGTYFGLATRLVSPDGRAIDEQVLRVFSRIDQLERDRSERIAFAAYARGLLRPAFDQLGWDPKPGENADHALLRPRLIGALGDFNDEAIIAEAKRRFGDFLADPTTLPTNLRAPVTHMVGRAADRATYDTLLARARKATNAEERNRYYSAAAAALDPDLATATLALTLTDELPTNMVGSLISEVAAEHRELAWRFVREHFEALSTRLGPTFRERFVANLLANFSDAAHAAELDAFAPAHETSGGRAGAARARERITSAADFIAQQLPAVEAWVAQHGAP